MDRDAIIKIIEDYLLAFDSGDFSQVKFSSKIQFISLLSKA